MKINVDIDGVLADNIGFFRQYINQEYGVEVKKELFNDYNPYFSQLDKNLLDIINNDIYENNPESIYYMDTVKDSVESLKNLKEKGHTINIVTHRPKLVEEETINWINNHGFYYDKIVVDSPSDKSKIDCDLMIDDNPEVVIDFSKKKNQDAILFPQLWNINSKLIHHHGPHHHAKENINSIIKNENQWEYVTKLIDDLKR